MKFYSELTKKLYDSQADLQTAEENLKNAEAIKKKKDMEAKLKRAEDVKKVNQALAEEKEAQRKANKALQDFVKKYGYFHTSFTLNDAEAKAVRDNVINSSLGSLLDLLASFVE